jgi:hypothetical protein
LRPVKGRREAGNKKVQTYGDAPRQRGTEGGVEATRVKAARPRGIAAVGSLMELMAANSAAKGQLWEARSTR